MIKLTWMRDLDRYQDEAGKLYTVYEYRKLLRVEEFQKYRYKNKLVTCTACSGSGFYDNNGSPKCGSCAGTGKMRDR